MPLTRVVENDGVPRDGTAQSCPFIHVIDLNIMRTKPFAAVVSRTAGSRANLAARHAIHKYYPRRAKWFRKETWPLITADILATGRRHVPCSTKATWSLYLGS